MKRVPRAGVRVEQGGTASDSSDISTFTFNTVNIGTAASDRILVILISEPTGATESFNYCNVDGVAATLRVEVGTSSTAAARCMIATISKATGTTANFEIDFNGSSRGCSIRVFAVYGANSTPLNTGSTALSTNNNGAYALSCSITNVAAGACFAIVTGNDSGDPSAPQWTWTNATEVDDARLEATRYWTSAYNESPEGVTSVTATFASNLDKASICAISFQPA